MWLLTLLADLEPQNPEPMPIRLQILSGAMIAAGIIMVLLGLCLHLEP